jgi:hypothetical protein
MIARWFGLGASFHALFNDVCDFAHEIRAGTARTSRIHAPVWSLNSLKTFWFDADPGETSRTRHGFFF